jgi:uncharacterized protein (DUF2126 family)
MTAQTDLNTYDLVVGGETVAADSGGYFETVDPATEEPLAKVARARKPDIERAVSAATDAREGWSSTAPQERGRLLSDLAERIRANQERLALLETRDNGTPLIRCQIRLRTSKGQVAASDEGYGARNAFGVALDTLERRVLELKGVQADEEYRGQLLRKLNEL